MLFVYLFLSFVYFVYVLLFVAAVVVVAAAVVVIIIVVMFLSTHFYTGCILEAGQGTSPFCHSYTPLR